MFPPTIDYFLSAIYQFQQEFYDYNLPRYYDLMDEIFEGKYLWKDRRRRYTHGESTKQKRERKERQRRLEEIDPTSFIIDDAHIEDPQYQGTDQGESLKQGTRGNFSWFLDF
jgi:hypothetical protein